MGSHQNRMNSLARLCLNNNTSRWSDVQRDACFPSVYCSCWFYNYWYSSNHVSCCGKFYFSDLCTLTFFAWQIIKQINSKQLIEGNTRIASIGNTRMGSFNLDQPPKASMQSSRMSKQLWDIGICFYFIIIIFRAWH